jgi:TPR repeat protein
MLPAIDALGAIYEEGLGVDKDIDKALKYYKTAADRGYQPSIKALKKLNYPLN